MTAQVAVMSAGSVTHGLARPLVTLIIRAKKECRPGDRAVMVWVPELAAPYALCLARSIFGIWPLLMTPVS